MFHSYLGLNAEMKWEKYKKKNLIAKEIKVGFEIVQLPLSKMLGFRWQAQKVNFL